MNEMKTNSEQTIDIISERLNGFMEIMKIQMESASKGREESRQGLKEFKDEIKSNLTNLEKKFVTHEEFKPIKESVQDMGKEFKSLRDEVKKYVAVITAVLAIAIPLVQSLISNYFSK